MRIQKPSRAGAWMATLALAAVLPGCGGGGGGGGTTPTPVTQPPAPVRTQIQQGGFTVGGFPGVATAPITISGAGTVEVVADWTFASSDIDIMWYAAGCTPLQAERGQCTILARTTSVTQKPERLIINNVAAGTYTVGVANYSSQNESGNYQVFLTR